MNDSTTNPHTLADGGVPHSQLCLVVSVGTRTARLAADVED